MNNTSKIIKFAEQVAKEDKKKMEKVVSWENHIAPLFKKMFDIDYRAEHRYLYPKKWQIWLQKEQVKFLRG